MRNTPIERKLIDETIEAFQIADFGNGCAGTSPFGCRCKS